MCWSAATFDFVFQGETIAGRPIRDHSGYMSAPQPVSQKIGRSRLAAITRMDRSYALAITSNCISAQFLLVGKFPNLNN